MIDLSINGYDFSNLNQQDLKKIQQLEADLNNGKNPDEQIILLAFKKNQ